MTQISTSVQQATEVAATKPTAATMRAASLVPVDQDTPGMEPTAMVNSKHYCINISFK